MRIKGRYEIRGILGEGGMGIVYRAEDLNIRTEVAVKTIRDPHDAACFELFKKECAVLTSLNHANIVDIRDIGEYEENGVTRPYLVMPLLPGMTLDKIIEKQPGRLTPERVVDMMVQVCRGLQAAHDARLIHRDLKPSNLFVFEDDSVKIIDFGIAHLADQHSTVGGKGTPHYMSPEQVTGGRLTPESDIFALGVICFECLTRRRPFAAGTRDEVFQNILRATPPATSDLNPAVPQLLSQVIHLAMAKQPVFRYRSAREFAECLQKGVRNEPMDRFDAATLAPRIGRIRQALESSDYEDAHDLLNALEAEGYLHPEIPSLRKQATVALRNRKVGQLLDSAKRLFEKGEHQLVMEKLQRVLEEEPTHAEALQLMAAATGKRQEDQYNKWISLAEEHLENFSFAQAREAARHAQEMETTDRVLQLLSEIDAKERDYQRIRKEKEELFQSALEHQRVGNLTQAAEKLERLVIINNRAPEKTSPDRGAAYEKLFNEVKSERDTVDAARAEAAKLLQGKEYAAAIAICDQYLEKYPRHALLRNLRLEIGERQQQDLSEYIAKVDRDAQAEPDLDRRVALYQQALQRFPGEAHFSRTLRIVSERRDAIHSHVAEARNKEERGQCAEALSQWETLRTLYPQYPGLELEIERVRRRRDDQAREEERAAVVTEIRRRLSVDELEEAARLATEALAERPDDPEIRTLNELARNRVAKAAQASAHLEAGKAAQSRGDLEEAIIEFRHAFEIGEKQMLTKARLVDAMVARSRELMEREPEQAFELTRAAIEIDDGNPKARAQFALLTERGRKEEATAFLQRAGAAQERGDLNAALREVDAGLQQFPNHDRLTRFGQTLREADLERVKALRQSLRQAPDPGGLNSIFAEIQQVVVRHGTDPRFQEVARQASAEKESLGLTMSMAATKVAGAAAGVGGSVKPSGRDPLPTKPPAPPSPPPPAAVSAKPAPIPVELPMKAISMGVAAFSLLLLIPTYFIFRPKAPAVAQPKVVVPAPETPAVVAPVASRKPGLVINFAAGGKVTLRNSSGTATVIEQRDVPVDIEPGTYELSLQDRLSQTYAATLQINEQGQIKLTNVKPSPMLILTILELRSGQARIFGAQFAGATKESLESVPADGYVMPIPASSTLVAAVSKQYPFDVVVKPEDRPIIQLHVYDTGLAVARICQLPPGATAELRIGTVRRVTKADKLGCTTDSLYPGRYLVTVTADGWAPRTGEVVVDLTKPNRFNLPPTQQLPGRIQVASAEPGAEVRINDTPAGVIGADGTFGLETSAGQKSIQLRKRNFASAPAESITVEPGKVFSWSGASKLTPRKFPVTVVTNPNSAVVSVRPTGGSYQRLDGKSIELAAGNYDFSAQANGYITEFVTHTIGEGAVGEVSIILRKETGSATTGSGKTVVTTKLIAIGCFQSKQGCGPFPGSFVMTVKAPGKVLNKSIDWSIGRANFSLGKNTIKVRDKQSPHSIDFGETVTIGCTVGEREIQCQADGQSLPAASLNEIGPLLRVTNRDRVVSFQGKVTQP